MERGYLGELKFLLKKCKVNRNSFHCPNIITAPVIRIVRALVPLNFAEMHKNSRSMLSQLLAECVVILRYVQPAKFLQRKDGEVHGTLSDGNWIEKRLQASYYAYNIIHQFYKYNTATHVQQKQKKSLLFQAVHAFGNRTLLILSGLIPGRVPWRLQSSNAYPEAWIVKIRRKMFRWEYRDEQQDKRGRERRQGLSELRLLSVRVIGHQKTAPLIGHYLPFPSIYLSLLYFLFSASAPRQYLPSPTF